MRLLGRYRRQNTPRSVRTSAVLLGIAGILFTMVSPIFIPKASAAGETSVNIMEGTPLTIIPGAADGSKYNKLIKYGTCIGQFTAADKLVTITQGVIDLFNKAENPIASTNPVTPQYLTADQNNRLKAELGQPEPAIEFSAGSPPAANGLPYSNDPTACANFTLYYIGNYQYAAPQAHVVDKWQTAILTFPNGTSNTGTFDYYVPSTKDTGFGTSFLAAGHNTQHETTSMTVGGTAPCSATSGGGGGSVTLSSINAKWIDAAHIQITKGGYDAGPNSDEGAYNDEIYVKALWASADETVNGKAESFYFLETTGANATAERQQEVAGAAPQCVNPIPGGQTFGQNGQGCIGSTSNCVPFMEVQQAINFSGSDSSNDHHSAAVAFGAEVGKLGSAPVFFYDYNANCTPNSAAPVRVTMSDTDKARIWLNYSTSNDAFNTVFGDGSANESQFIGTYGLQTKGVYIGGNKGCALVIPQSDPTATGSSANGTNPNSVDDHVFEVIWNLTTQCNPPANNQVTVAAIGGTVGEQGYNGTTTSDGSGSAKSPTIGCDLFSGIASLINWLICPIVAAATGAASALDNQINEWLNQDATQVFQAQGGGTNQYYNSWKQFRLIGLSIVAIAGLVMVFAQAMGSNNAYAIRKTLPRIVAVAIVIPFLWPLLQGMGLAGYAIGNDIRHLIYQALATPESSTTISASSSYVILLLGSGAVLAFGILGLLTFALSALLAVFVGYITVTLIQIVGILVTVASPLIVACAILEPLKKVFTFGRDTIIAIYLFIPIAFGLVIAIFRSASAAA